MSDQLPSKDKRTLEFTVSSQFAHFKKIDGNLSRLTYKIPPRTTIIGMLAGILGYERDQYYTEFSSDNCVISIEPLEPIRTFTIPQSLIGTSSMTSIKSSGRNANITINFPDSTKSNTQRRIFEFIMEPEYRVYLQLTNDELFEELSQRLRENRYVYTPYLGLSECLADITDVEVHQSIYKVENPEIVDTPVYDTDSVKPTSKSEYIMERSPMDMEQAEGTTGLDRRMTTKFSDYIFANSDEGIELTSENEEPVFTVNGSTIMFIR